jgi:AcrR family transcriptional regulator
MVDAAGTVPDRRESATALDRLAVGASPTRHANARSELTRIRLTETAEELFAERGLQAVSLRDVCAAAGQRNHSAAQYHFGSRLGLVVAVFEHRMHAVTIAATRCSTSPRTATSRPSSTRWSARFLERIRWDPLTSDALAGLLTWTSHERAVTALAAQLPDLPAAVLDRDLIATIVAVVTAPPTPVATLHPIPWETR